MKLKLVALALVLSAIGCRHAPPQLTPHYQVVWQANEVGNSIQQVQTGAVFANGAGFLSVANTGIVVDAVAIAMPILHATPEGYKAVISTFIDAIRSHMDMTGNKVLLTSLASLQAYINSREPGELSKVSRDLPPSGVTDEQMQAVFDSTVAHALADGAKWRAAHPKP